MNTIVNNPYRTVGLLVGATAKEQSKQISRLKKYIEAEQDPQDDYSLPALGNLHRTLETIEEAAAKLNLDSDKINAALFWYWNGNPITDEGAFEALKSGDIEAANKIWDKLITRTDEEGKRFWKPVSEKNYSAFHNYSVLNIIRTNGNLSNAVVAGLYFLESDLVDKFVSSVADETHKTNKKELQLLFLNQLHADIEANRESSLPKFLEILKNHEFVAKEDFMKGFVQKPIEQIEQKIEKAKNNRKTSKSNAARTGQELFNAVSNDLEKLKSIVGLNDIKYSSVADKVANEILQCSIDFFNESQESGNDSDYLETAMRLAKQAEALAVGKLTKDRVKDSLETLSEMKDKEISSAIEVLQSIKEAFLTNKAKIEDEVSNMSLGFNQTINWSKVDQMIENSLNWDKVVELIHRVIPPQNIDKIKNINNSTKLNEYKSLVIFVMSKLSYTQKNKVRYISYWENQGSIAVPTSGDIAKLPDLVKWVVGIILLIILIRACS
jgi:tetratricopeptide (TPR) repeat protein